MVSAFLITKSSTTLTMLPEPNSYRRADIEELKNGDRVMVDVRTAESFAERRIPGAVNHCVYEVAFMEEFPEAYPDRVTPIMVYGEGEPYKADLAAVGRLQALGYKDVAILEGGLSRWRGAGRETEGNGPSTDALASGTLKLDKERSKVRWVGRNLTNRHDGEVALVDGDLELADGKFVGGEVTVDLRKMSCRDITDSKLAKALIGHLQNADFFEVEKYPLARFTVKRTESLKGASYGRPNYAVEGVLSARGRELELTIEALVEAVDGGYVFQANFEFDRVALGACYGSGKLFERLGMHLVNDLVSIDVLAVFSGNGE